MSENNPKLDNWYKKIKWLFVGLLIYIAGHYFMLLADYSEKSRNHRIETTTEKMPDTISIWNSSEKLKLKEQMMGREDLQKLKVKPRADFCNCLIHKLEVAYPKGFYNTPDTVQVSKMNIECLDSLTFRSAQKSDGTTIFKDLNKM